MVQHAQLESPIPATTLDETVDTIGREIGLDQQEVAERMAFLELRPEDLVLLRELHALAAQDSDTFSDGFYEHILAFPQLRSLVGDDSTIQRLKHAQAAYFRSLTAGDYDGGYIRDRLRVGLVHQRIGLEPKWYIGAYRKYVSGMFELLWSHFHDDPARFRAMCDCVLKVVCLDMGLALDTYAHADQRSVVQHQNYLEQIIGGMPAGLIVTDGGGRVRSINQTMRDMLGIPEDALAGQPALDALLPSHELAERMEAALASGAPQDGIVITVDGHADGVRYFEFNIRRTRQADEQILLLIGHDITFRRQARLRLQESEEFFRLTFTQAAVGIALLSREGRFVRVNRKLTQIVGYTEIELLQRFVHQITYQNDLLEDRALLRQLIDGEIRDFRRETRFVSKRGSPIWVTVSASAMREALSGELRLIIAVEDISRRKQAEEALLRMANHDALTGLPNRILLQDRLSHAIAQAQRNGRLVGVMFIDLDRFKHVNDSLGHEAGDQMIIEIARRLSRSLRESDTVARQGGDEFVVVLPDLAGADDAAMVARKVLGELFQPLMLAGNELFPTGSIGIAIYPRDGQDPTALLKAADTAMYRSKANGGNHFHFYTEDLGMRAEEHLLVEARLQRALQRGELRLHYQPQFDVASGRIVGLEALLRWEAGGREVLAAAEFIPLAEETGLIVPIGEWALATAMRQLAAFSRLAPAPLRMSVNVSARQFHQQDIAAGIERLLADTGCDPGALTLEITETLLMESPGAAAEAMARLSRLGIQLAIDDFCTGYSSLANLRRFPIHGLKIDRSFIADIPDDDDAAAIVHAVIALAGSMKLDVVAVGVETAAQQAFLEAHGCHRMQGYRFGRPVPAEEIERMLRQGCVDAAA
ncbi:EAL domain-containing protein [Massilia oculi]|uniref:Diguanylate cyclase DosC n=1 Tax=Massilia hydrophila TaxID=3044279 RepID=A0ABS7Y8P6_9BURK|nr:EAL domain-containing protein [Massilia oculi]MCA1855703.1 EAL domain-containing protein [Massilia oculi]